MAQPVGVAGAPSRPAPKPKPPAPSTSVGAGLGRITNSLPQASRSSPGSDIQSSGAGYGSAQANAYKQTPAYQKIVRQVFAVQPLPQKAAIIRGLVQNTGGNPYNLPEYKAIRSQWDHLATQDQIKIQQLIPHDLPAFISPKGPGLFGAIEGGLKAGGGALAGLIQQIPLTRSGGGGFYQAEGIANAAAPGTVAKNFAKDAVNLPAEAIPSLAIPIGEALRGHPGQALNTAIVGPVKQLLANPIGAAAAHPLNTLLLGEGILHGGTRIIDQGGRALIGKPADLNRPGIDLTASLTRERPKYSKYPEIRRRQKLYDRANYKPSPVGKGLVPRSENVRQAMIREGTSRAVGVNERVRRVELQAQRTAHEKSILAPLPSRAAHAIKTAGTYNPDAALIHYANLIARVAGGTIRRPDTFVEDLTKHIQDVSAGRGDLLNFPKTALANHDEYVKLLTELRDRAAKDPKLAEHLQPLFDAATKYAHDFGAHGHESYAGSLEGKAYAFGHYGKGITKAMLERRALAEIAHSHMPGVRFDPVLQTFVRDASKTEEDAAVSRLRDQLRTAEQRARHRADQGLDAPGVMTLQDQIRQIRETHAVPVSTKAMREFAMRETGGRPIAYVSHRRPRGDSAFYVNGQDFPRREVQRNSLFAYRHGLTDPTHISLLEARAHLQGVVSAHAGMGRLLKLLTLKNGKGYWDTFQHAKDKAADLGGAYRPIWVGPIHGNGLDVSPSDAVNAAALEQEAQIHGLDLGQRLQPSDATGHWALIEKTAVDQLNKHKNQISPNALGRLGRASTTQFRRVALGTSAKHIPGVIQENLIRDIASGTFVHHWFAFRNVYREAAKINPELAAVRKTELTGGQVAGETLALARRQTARHFSGTPFEPMVRNFDKFMRFPGPRQLSTAWNAWTKLAINGTKRMLEESHQQMAVGKQLLDEFGGLMRLQGDAAREAAVKGFLPDKAARRLRAETERMFGKWTDLTPEAQSLLAVSPFGMWWVNSAKWLSRLPVDHPIHTGVLAAASTGTEKQRQTLGLDMFAPNHLPLYMQGGIPSGGGILAQNYYSPFGVANDPIETAQSLILPTLTPVVLAGLGDNWLGREMSSPQHPHGGKTNPGVRARVIVNSVLGMMIPLYQKLETTAAGGQSEYDTSTLIGGVQTKQPSKGAGAGLEKAFRPFRFYKTPAAAGASSSSGGGFLGSGGGGGSSSSGGGSGFLGS